jgi:hypothetical protein
LFQDENNIPDNKIGITNASQKLELNEISSKPNKETLPINLGHKNSDANRSGEISTTDAHDGRVSTIACQLI